MSPTVRRGTIVSVIMPETSVAAQPPSVCPSWCKDRDGRHSPRTRVAWHWSPQQTLANTDVFCPDEDTILGVELVRCDEDGHVGEARLYVSGESHMELTAGETDIFLIQLQAFVDTVRVLRRQMDAR